MTDQPNPHAPFKPPFLYDESRAEVEEFLGCYRQGEFPSVSELCAWLDQRDLLNRDAEQARQPKPEHPEKEVK